MSVAEVYRRTRKVPDLPWNAYVCRPLAAVVVDLLKASRVTPNQITLSALLVTLGSALILILVPGYAGLLAGVLLFELSYVLDCADGMLARWRGIASVPGHLLDFLMDEIKAFLVLAAVAIRLFLERADPRFLISGLVGLVALASGVALTTFIRRPEIAGPEAAGTEANEKRLSGVVLGIAKLLIHYPSYIWFFAIVNRVEFYFFPYIAVNALYAGRAFLSVAVRFGRFEPANSGDQGSLNR